MDEEQKKQVAIFRFSVIADFVNNSHLQRGEKQQLLEQKCGRKWDIPFSHKTRLTRTTILRWLQSYQASNGKLESLYPQDRSDQGKSRALDEETALALIGLRKSLPKAPIDFLISQMYKRQLVSAGLSLTKSTVYRFLHQQGLMNFAQSPVDRRKFEAELPNDLWQSDSMHGPKLQVDGKNKKSYLFAFVDDHSRLVPYAEFYLSEALDCYLDALRQALSKRGLPRKLYVDNAAAFRSKHLEHISASLGIALVHCRPYKPQGRGKIERFFRTVREQFLTDFKGTTLQDLNEALELWLGDVYHQRKHSATGQSPFERFTNHMECLREAPKDLQDHFRKAARRRVAKDRTISLNGRLYEAPVALIGKQVLLLYHEHVQQRVEVFFNNQSHGWVNPVNLSVNCRVKRDKYSGIAIESPDDHQTYQGGRLWSKEDKK